MTAKMIKVGFLVAAAIGIFARNASAEECNACHSGQKLPPMEKELKIEMPAPAPTIAIPEYSAHAGIDCQDCHAGANAMPHPPKMPAVNCNICHSDMVGDLGGSSHGAKLSKYLAKTGGEVKLSEICLACHGSDVHSVRKTDDPLSPVARANLAGACLKCHDQVEPIAIKQYVASIHGKACAKGNLKAAVCSDCHGSHAINHSKMTNSQVYREAVPDTCGKCHEQAAKEYKESIHWKVVQEGFKDAPICTDCHGEHGIRSRKDPLSATFSANITMTCAHCHESELINTKFMIPKGRVKTFMGSFHGLSGSLGDVRVANCSSCHGNHDILPASDPKSSVNSANLGQTCGKCHPGAESRFISEPIHKKREESSRLVMWVRNLYIVMIGLTLGGMLFHNSLDLAFKTTKGMPFRRREKIIPRLNLNERIFRYATENRLGREAALSPRDPALLLPIAQAYLEGDLPDKALGVLDQALRGSPATMPDQVIGLARGYKPLYAARIAQLVIQRAPEYLPAYLTLGVAYEQMGKYPAACEAWREVLRRFPHSEAADQVKAKFEQDARPHAEAKPLAGSGKEFDILPGQH